jgi:hypothetical protein
VAQACLQVLQARRLVVVAAALAEVMPLELEPMAVRLVRH